MVRTATLDLNSRGSFVDDLNSKPGIVMCRDALLHRAHEIQPAFFDSEKKQEIVFFHFLFFYFFVDLFVSGSLNPEIGHARDFRAPKYCGAPRPERNCASAVLKCEPAPNPKHTFSAFWLRSSVVSVLISLISGTWRMASHEFK